MPSRCTSFPKLGQQEHCSESTSLIPSPLSLRCCEGLDVELTIGNSEVRAQKHSQASPQHRLFEKKLGIPSSMIGVSVNAVAMAVKTVIAALRPMKDMKCTGKTSIVRKHTMRVIPEIKTVLPDVASMISTDSTGDLLSFNSF